ncbi:MAG: ribosome maturation factor RimM [Bdellovibrionota bacterium]|nr:16S rRNA processing protein RimM [Deltaproteobacteria bacterium]
MKQDQKVFLGVLGKPRGLKGHIRLHLYNPDTTLIKKNLLFYIEGESASFIVESFAPYQKSHILTIRDHADVNLVEKLKGKKVFVLREQLQELDDNEYYHVDLIGLDVVNMQGLVIGVVTEVLATGANDVLCIEGKDGQEVLIPFVDEYVLDVKMDENRIEVIVPEVLQ